MNLNVPTLLLVTGIVAFATGILLAVSWLQNQRDRSLYFWAISNIIGSLAPLLFIARGQISDLLSIHGANIAMILSVSVAWAGTRLFQKRPIHWAVIAAGPVAWIVLTAIPAFGQSMAIRTIIGAAIISTYVFASAREHWLGRHENLMSRWPTILILLVFGTCYAARIPAAINLDIVDQRDFFAGPAVATTSMIALVFVVAISFLRLALVRERAEAELRKAASTDLLTGIGNRRAFIENAEQTAAKAAISREPCALLVLDIDHFKAINDQLGHSAGDMVLREFAQRLSQVLGDKGQLARLGGEEFAVFLCNQEPCQVYEIAEMLRTSVADQKFATGDVHVTVTVSIGISFSDCSGWNIDTLLKDADTALYCAKHNGRDRIECAFAVESQMPRQAA